jgi:hypothetical protein
MERKRNTTAYKREGKRLRQKEIFVFQFVGQRERDKKIYKERRGNFIWKNKTGFFEWIKKAILGSLALFSFSSSFFILSLTERLLEIEIEERKQNKRVRKITTKKKTTSTNKRGRERVFDFL